MRNIFLIILFLSTVFSNINAQKRINKITLNFSENSEKIKKSTGWIKNEHSGKWIENDRLIHKAKANRIWGTSYYKFNFKWLQFKTVKKDDETFYVFLYQNDTGYYYYQYIKEKWISYRNIDYFILTEKQFHYLKDSLKTNKELKIHIESPYFGSVRKNKGEQYLLESISRNLEKNKNSSYMRYFDLEVLFENNEKLIRFLTPYPTSYNYDKEKALLDQYYEVKTSIFEKLFIIKSH